MEEHRGTPTEKYKQKPTETQKGKKIFDYFCRKFSSNEKSIIYFYSFILDGRYYAGSRQ